MQSSSAYLYSLSYFNQFGPAWQQGFQGLHLGLSAYTPRVLVPHLVQTDTQWILLAELIHIAMHNKLMKATA